MPTSSRFKNILRDITMPERDKGDLEYEMDEAGQRVLVRSMESIHQVYLRFTNKTSRPLDVWWRNFQGIRKHYFRLQAGNYYDVNSYITHPWEFTDVTTKERYVINNQHIYRPPKSIIGMMDRINCNITAGVRSLRRTALVYLALRLSDACEVVALGLPRELAEELEDMVEVFHQEPPLELST